MIRFTLTSLWLTRREQHRRPIESDGIDGSVGAVPDSISARQRLPIHFNIYRLRGVERIHVWHRRLFDLDWVPHRSTRGRISGPAFHYTA